MKPPSGSMVYWRLKNSQAFWHFGYVTYLGELMRMGRYNGDTLNGPIVLPSDIEWKPYIN